MIVNLEEKYGAAPILPLSSPNATECDREGVSSTKRFAKLPHDEPLCLWDNAARLRAINLEEKYGGAPILPLSSAKSTEDDREEVSTNRRFAKLPHDELLCLWDNALTIFHNLSQSTLDSRSLL